MSNNVLITGGAGFIGSHLSDFLVNRGYNVIAVDDLSLGNENNIRHLMQNNKYIFHKIDVCDYKRMLKILNGKNIDIVFHLAANSDIAKSYDDPATDKDRTFMTTFYTLEIMRLLNIKKIVFASSSAIYGQVSKKINEEYGPLLPVSHYGASKLASEAFISSYASNYNVQAWIIRFPNVVGERATHGVIFDFINKLRKDPNTLSVLGNGEQTKPYLYVKDLVEGIYFIFNNANEKINLFNLGVETRTKVNKIAEMVIEEMGLHATIEYTGGERGWVGDVPEFKYDLQKINSLGWKAQISSDDAVRKSIKYILNK